jgi:hypothetical protein
MVVIRCRRLPYECCCGGDGPDKHQQHAPAHMPGQSIQHLLTPFRDGDEFGVLVVAVVPVLQTNHAQAGIAHRFADSHPTNTE